MATPIPSNLDTMTIPDLTDLVNRASQDTDLDTKKVDDLIRILAERLKNAPKATPETKKAAELIDKIAEQDSDNHFPAALENYTKHKDLSKFKKIKGDDDYYLLEGFDDINNLPENLVKKVWNDIMERTGLKIDLDAYKNKGNKDLSLMSEAFEKLQTAYNEAAESEHSADPESDSPETSDKDIELQEMMKILTNQDLIQNWQNGDTDAEKALNKALSAIKRRTNNLAVAPEALKKQVQSIANDLAEKGLGEAFSLYNKHKDKNNYKGWESAETKFNLKGFPDDLQDKIIKDILGAIGGGVKKEDILDKDGDTIVGLKLKPEHSDALKTALTKNASAGKSSSTYVGLDSFLNDVVAKSWEKTWDSYQKTVLSKADPLDMGVAFCEGLLLMPLQNLSTMMANFDEWIKNRNLRLSEDKWAKLNSKDPFNNNAGDNPSDGNNSNGGNGGNGTVINIYGPVIGSNLNFGNQNGANIMIGGYDLQQALNAGVSLEALMKGNAQLAPQDTHVLGLMNSAAAILRFKDMYLKNLYRDSAEHPEMRDFAEKLEAIWDDPNFKGMGKLADLQEKHPELGKQMNAYLADMLADSKNADMFKLLSETKIIPAEALQALTLLGVERQSGKGKDNDKEVTELADEKVDDKKEPTDEKVDDKKEPAAEKVDDKKEPTDEKVDEAEEVKQDKVNPELAAGNTDYSFSDPELENAEYDANRPINVDEAEEVNPKPADGKPDEAKTVNPELAVGNTDYSFSDPELENAEYDANRPINVDEAKEVTEPAAEEVNEADDNPAPANETANKTEEVTEPAAGNTDTLSFFDPDSEDAELKANRLINVDEAENPIKIQKKNRNLTTHTTELDLKSKTITFSYKTILGKTGSCSCNFENNSITMQQGKGKERTFTKKGDLWYSGDTELSAEQQVSLNDYFDDTSVRYNQLQSAENKEYLEDKLTAMQTPSIKKTKTLLDAFKGRHI